MSTGWWTYFQRQMKRRQMSQADIARELGVPSSTVSRWRTQAPTTETIRRLAPILRVPVIRLLVEAGHLERTDLEEPEPIEPADPANNAEAAIEERVDLSRQEKDILLGVLRTLRGGGGTGGARVTKKALGS